MVMVEALNTLTNGPSVSRVMVGPNGAINGTRILIHKARG